ncbi:hypothetical protein A9P44_00415 [Paenibacillus polymyxa]|nr:hypothetical protein [Paenibacillus polymyxa]OBA07850.1 hypothetical protein A9P44_00415 [Paenibacillus polymyxa]
MSEQIKEIKERFEFNLRIAETTGGATGAEYKDIQYLLNLVDSLQQQLAERDQTIALITKDHDILLEQSIRELAAAEKNWREKGDENRRLREALKEIADTKYDMSGVLGRVTARRALGRE